MSEKNRLTTGLLLIVIFMSLLIIGVLCFVGEVFGNEHFSYIIHVHGGFTNGVYGDGMGFIEFVDVLLYRQISYHRFLDFW